MAGGGTTIITTITGLELIIGVVGQAIVITAIKMISVYVVITAMVITGFLYLKPYVISGDQHITKFEILGNGVLASNTNIVKNQQLHIIGIKKYHGN
jgi:hypothetical protein